MATRQMIASAEERRLLLGYARATARQALGEAAGAAPRPPRVAGRFGGVFVTLYRGATLRGCIGSFAPTEDLAATVADMTRAALRDPRFVANPVTLDELSELTIEISVLTDPVRTDDPRSLEPGRHGIIIRHPGGTGCFLPKVATDNGWSAEEFLSTCCTMKAGLSSDGWRRPDTEVLLFEADAFSDRAGCA